MAGLACAQLLAEAGCRVDIFEKSRGPSGRMSTRRAQDPQGAWQCDHGAPSFAAQDPEFVQEDRKSTRLNSSHLVISYAVFCLKKKKTLQLAISESRSYA